MKVGYIRVSSADQNTARQEKILAEMGVEKVFMEKISGKDTKREKLQELMGFVREGDIVIVESISRFARNTKDLLDLIEKLNAKKVEFVSQKETIDTTTAQGRFTLTIFGALAEMERDCIRERQAEGIAIARAEGRFQGRPPKKIANIEETYDKIRSKEISFTEGARQLGVSRSTLYRKFKEYEGEQFLDF